jgi:hypothetical protein
MWAFGCRGLLLVLSYPATIAAQAPVPAQAQGGRPAAPPVADQKVGTASLPDVDGAAVEAPAEPAEAEPPPAADSSQESNRLLGPNDNPYRGPSIAPSWDNPYRGPSTAPRAESPYRGPNISAACAVLW